MKHDPLVSIIIPVYNVEKFLPACLTSVITQTYSNLEIIVINDESTDSSFNICQHFSMQDSRIKLFSQKNSGPSTARNLGLQKSHGEYFFFLDSDDTLDKNLIKHMVSFSEKENVQITFCGTTFEGEKSYIESPVRDKKISNIEAVRMCLRNKNGILHSPWGKLFKIEQKSYLNFPKNMKYYEDEYVIYDIILKSTTGVISGDTYHYKIRKDSLIKNITKTSDKTRDFKKAILHLNSLFAYNYPILESDYIFRFVLDNITLIKFNILNKADNDTLTFGENNIRNVSLYKIIKSNLGTNLLLECLCIKYFPKLFKAVYKRKK